MEKQMRIFKRTKGRQPRLLLWALPSSATLGAVVRCGTGGYFSQSNPTYTIIVTETSGSLVHSPLVTLTAQ